MITEKERNQLRKQQDRIIKYAERNKKKEDDLIIADLTLRDLRLYIHPDYKRRIKRFYDSLEN